jgi:DHA1 family bicyclomycin/chloramphenicol resistance-like MFS transporter
MSSVSPESESSQQKSDTRLAILLAALSMLGPFSVDAYLPAFPAIQASLQVSAIEVQQTLTAYMMAFSFMMLWHGAISDALGRRNIILVSLFVFAVASLACAASHTIQYLWVFRILQGLSAGAGMVVGRAIIRDIYHGAAAQRLLSLVTMIFSIAPAVAPILGGWVVTLSDWRSIFLFLVVYTAALIWFCFRYLPESLPVEKRHAFSIPVLWANYKAVFSSSSFHLQSGTVAFNFAGLFLYVASAPVFLTQHLGLSAHGFGWQFVPMVGGIFLGALGANRYAGRIPLFQQVRIGYFFLAGAAICNVMYHVIFPPAIPWSVIPLFFYAIGMSFVAPGVTLMTLDLFPHTRGIVASCQSCAVTFLGGIVAGVIAPILDQSPIWLACGQLGFVVCAMLCWHLSKQAHENLLTQ